MAIRANGYYNDPNIARAAANLAGLFAPPSAGEAAGWATANAKKEEAARLAQLFEYSRSPNYAQDEFDRMATAAGLYNPTQSYYRVNTDDATNRRGQDITARTAITNNTADNRARVLSNLFQPLGPGQVRPELPGGIAGAYGMPEMDVPQAAGVDKPLTETEMRAAIIGGLPDDQKRAFALGDTPVENVVTPEGPRMLFRPDAVGMEPLINKGAEARPDVTNYRTPDGSVGTAVYDPQLGLVDTQTRQPLPAGTQTYKANAQGGVDDVLGKTTANRVDQQMLDIAVAKNTAVKLRDMIAASPASQGIVGWLRGTTQNVIAAGGEVGQYFGGGVNEIQQRIARGLEGEDLAGAFDPNIPAIEMMANLLAFQYAKTTTGERLSNEMLRATRSALGLDGLTANQQSSLARLNQAIKLIEDQESILGRAKAGGVGAVTQPAPGAPQAAPMPGAAPAAPPVGGAERWERGPDGRLRKVQ